MKLTSEPALSGCLVFCIDENTTRKKPLKIFRLQNEIVGKLEKCYHRRTMQNFCNKRIVD